MSRSEAGQSKELLVLDADFAVVEHIPLDLGPRHFLLEAAGEPLPPNLRAGDR